MQYIYGPIPSRRLGFSLGISAIPEKTCNYSCVYCQLGRTNHLTNSRKMFFPIEDIIKELDEALKTNIKFDVISIVGEGEPTLFQGLGDLITMVKERTTKPVTVITNGALLYDEEIQNELMKADIVLPSLNAYDEETFKKINRPSGRLDFHEVLNGLISFSHRYQGSIWLEIMFVEGMNDDNYSLQEFKKVLSKIKYDRLYLNTPVRPPAEIDVKPISHERMERAVEVLGGISIDLLSSELYQSNIKDDYEAILSIIQRHPMNQHEIEAFLNSRNCKDTKNIFERLEKDPSLNKIDYKGYHIYRIKL